MPADGGNRPSPDVSGGWIEKAVAAFSPSRAVVPRRRRRRHWSCAAAAKRVRSLLFKLRPPPRRVSTVEERVRICSVQINPPADPFSTPFRLPPRDRDAMRRRVFSLSLNSAPTKRIESECVFCLGRGARKVRGIEGERDLRWRGPRWKRRRGWKKKSGEKKNDRGGGNLR